MIFFLLKKSFDASEVPELLYFEVLYLELLPFSSFFPSVVFLNSHFSFSIATALETSLIIFYQGA